ncbi:MAG TPA: hypothetical protein VF730_13515 [Terracidiphilus sp.]
MLTALSIKKKGQKDATVLYATHLLAMLQQALPGVEKPEGNGVLAAPWIPKTPAQWWYCSKEKPKRIAMVTTNPTTKVTKTSYTFNETQRFWNDATDLAWLKVGNKYISIKPDNFYASQHEDPARGSTAVPKATYEDAAYSAIFADMSHESGNRVQDAGTAVQIRTLLKGGSGGARILPLLTSVLFLSEVARNHTAFHTNLMLLDLVEKGVSLTGGTTFKYTFRNVLWQPQIIDAVMELRRIEQREAALQNQRASLDQLFDIKNRGGWLGRDDFARLRNAKNENAAIRTGFSNVNRDRSTQTAAIGTAKRGIDELKSPTLASQGGEAMQPGGLASMSHKGSAYGAAYDLEGKGEYRGVKGGSAFTPPPTPMTIVRRKEATILIRWLERALIASGEYEAVALVNDPHLETRGLYDYVENSFGKTDDAFTKVLGLMQRRVDSFDSML